MTVCVDTRSSIRLVYTDDVPRAPHHIHSLQHDQQLLSLASRSFRVALAKQRLVTATQDNVRSEQHRLIRVSLMLGKQVLAHEYISHN